jgi:hypothetical protein
MARSTRALARPGEPPAAPNSLPRLAANARTPRGVLSGSCVNCSATAVRSRGGSSAGKARHATHVLTGPIRMARRGPVSLRVSRPAAISRRREPTEATEAPSVRLVTPRPDDIVYFQTGKHVRHRDRHPSSTAKPLRRTLESFARARMPPCRPGPSRHVNVIHRAWDTCVGWNAEDGFDPAQKHGLGACTSNCHCSTRPSERPT